MKKKIASLSIIISIVLAVVSIKLLPDIIVIQIGLNGTASRTAPKLIGVMIPLIITFAGSIMLLNETSSHKKSTIFILLGYLINALTLFFNL